MELNKFGKMMGYINNAMTAAGYVGGKIGKAVQIANQGKAAAALSTMDQIGSVANLIKGLNSQDIGSACVVYAAGSASSFWLQIVGNQGASQLLGSMGFSATVEQSLYSYVRQYPGLEDVKC
jgi:hypothetical protein